MPTLTMATPGEAAEGSCGAYCFRGGVESAKLFATGEADGFRGMGSSKVDGLRRGVATLPLAAAVDVFASAFAFFEAADFLALLIGRMEKRKEKEKEKLKDLHRVAKRLRMENC